MKKIAILGSANALKTKDNLGNTFRNEYIARYRNYFIY